MTGVQTCALPIYQIFAYNTLLHADYLVVSNGISHYCCKIDYTNRSYSFLSDIPRYEDL